jgi:asparagine synthase (glutamine-hydrolysing)
MCGICGIYLFEQSSGMTEQVLIETMNKSLLHRGPDEEGVYTFGPVALGHRRLSIIDVATGKQPMTNDDESVWLVFNGEIYNYRALRSELIQKGYRFRTGSDTEVIIHLYEEFGEEIFGRLNGMFAIGLWDARRKKLILARDRLGKKPVYYHVDSRRIVFASELKALLTLPDVPRRVDPDSVDHYLSFQYIPAPNTILSDICKLEPATYLACQEGKIRKERYWHVDFSRRYVGSQKRATDELGEMLCDAVKIRLESEVPLGAFLSGGVDSSAVVSLMARLTRQSVRTTSIGFAEADFDEIGYARLVADYLRTDHRDHILEAKFIKYLPRIVYHLDEPFGDASALPTYLLCQATRQHVTVALSGDGGDENFAGYSRYRSALQEQSWRNNVPRIWRSFALAIGKRLFSPRCRGFTRLENLNMDLPAAVARTFFCFTADAKKDLYTADFRRQFRGPDAYQLFNDVFPGDNTWPTLSRLQAFDLVSYLPEDILTKVDRMSMAHSLEVRAPLLDYRVVELAASMPPEWKLNGASSKVIFKDFARSLLPPEVVDRSKMGFSVPVGKWFRDQWRPLVERTILRGRFLQRGYFEPAAIRRLWESHMRDKFWIVDLGSHFWCLFVLELWHRLFVDGENIEQVTRELLTGMDT